jgi:hypothetical protein
MMVMGRLKGWGRVPRLKRRGRNKAANYCAVLHHRAIVTKRGQVMHGRVRCALARLENYFVRTYRPR